MQTWMRIFGVTVALLPVAGVACGNVRDGAPADEVGTARSALGPANSCFSYCGTVTPSGCWCDSLCTGAGDCCNDYTPQCVGGGSCANNCTSGAASGGGCYCDELCTGFGDCCSNYAAVCPNCGVTTRRWRPSVVIAPVPPPPFVDRPTDPDVGVDSNGEALAIWNYGVWTPTGSLTRTVRTRRYAFGAWGAETILATGITTPGRIEVGGSSRGFATFGSQERIFSPPSSWTDPGFTFDPVASAVDASSNTMALYRTGTALDARRYTFGGVLEASHRLSDDATMWDVAANKMNDFVAAYNRGSSLAMARYLSGVGWTGTTFATSGTSPKVGMALDESAIVVWLDGNAVKGIRVSGTGVSPVATIASYAESLGQLKLTVNASGRAIAVWKRNFPGGFNQQIFASTFYLPTGWSAPVPVTDVHSSPETPPGRPGVHDVGIDDCGAGHLVYEESPYTVYAMRYTPASGWGTTRTLITNVAERLPRMATAPNGITTVVWDGERGDVLAARFE
jgi:hypothetical protein